MKFFNILFLLIGIGLLIYAIYWLVHWIMRKRSAEIIDQYDLNEMIRKVQVVDVREPAEFKASRILGARNIPQTQFKMRFQEIRKDQPVVLYDTGMNTASRAANILRKNGYKEVYILKNGFDDWHGKTKQDI